MDTEQAVRSDTEQVLRGVMERWKAGIDDQDPEQVATVFTEDAIFQGLHPYTVGRKGVADYYAGQAPGMTVAYRILETRRPAADLALGYLDADFTFPDRPTVSIYLGVLVTRDDDGWAIAFYEASKLDRF
jgi:uncharacterized protein (TIGR02246 family)